MQEYLIRKMLPEDAGNAAALEASNFSQPWKKADFEKAASDADVLYLIAERDVGQQKEIIGCCGVRNLLGEGDITNVSVHSSFRRRGIAEALLKKLLAEGEKMGITAFTLEVRSGNRAAIALYEKLGFVTEGIRPRFYSMPEEDAVIMWKRQENGV
ncbi:MAG: ribosomal protein S18-alanine N-acetyltransferase [Lachnospiraceae bacterium]|nr:ribosomal protein S18-alanine N-acetyltransferase [Lachnospiraceae bacterium]